MPKGINACYASLRQLFKPLFDIKQVPRSVVWLATLDAVFCLAYVGTYLLAPAHFGFARYWDLDFEGGIATWYSMLKLLSIAILATVFVRRKVAEGQGSPVLFGLPTIFLAMAIDEIARLHERIGKFSDILLPDGSRANTPFQETGLWIFLVGIPFIVFFLWWIYRFKKKLAGYGAEVRMLGMGVFLLLLGALGVEFLSNFLFDDFTQLVGITLEEGLEMLGATVIFWAVLAMVRKKHPVAPFRNR
ncbi:hypothetical protein IQ260_29025 [Leptolyngbya cf. ectocarpi LEGE 11479]|uniref:Uncharacterized protein n=1 Tax=Leptolyngbya cf. ectocarpi LEGE 11479 TaxID=1828722 RepID=A0A929FDK3_LEPEC|nr:hypothetical protein [Leptolyngbya ectocarpi]MBE9070688.1 hypothetical protein [Leptolyngbya cf. ectocarpi LEGE 11479]